MPAVAEQKFQVGDVVRFLPRGNNHYAKYHFGGLGPFRVTEVQQRGGWVELRTMGGDLACPYSPGTHAVRLYRDEFLTACARAVSGAAND